MKKISILVCLLFAATFFSGICFAGEIRTLPQSIVLTAPTTDKVELITLTFHYGTNVYATAKYNVLDAAGNVRASHTVEIKNIQDDPDTVENEATTTFTNFVSGIGATLNTRSSALIWAHIQANYELQ